MDKKYYKKLWSVALILLGAYLIIEHILVWGQLDFMDFWGHEWLGFILILIGIIVNTNFKKIGEGL
jgi:uncharacterized membrane protein YoaK (UPF0700 family)